MGGAFVSVGGRERVQSIDRPINQSTDPTEQSVKQMTDDQTVQTHVMANHDLHLTYSLTSTSASSSRSAASVSMNWRAFRVLFFVS